MNETLTWDYTSLADTYHKRPNYPREIIDKIIGVIDLKPGDRVCDMGAGTGNLSMLFAKKDLYVQAVEPNQAMYELGVQRTRHNPKIAWVNTTAEDTRLKSNNYDMISFGSSFNVVDRTASLRESLRICKPCGWLMTIWNHRELNDPLQRRIETCIKERLPDYDYGLRRQDQREYLVNSGLFSRVEYFECSMRVKQPLEDVLEAWYSHATLQRQAGNRFDEIIQEIGEILREQGLADLETPYTSRAWVSRFHNQKA
jgi:ubiquinone/menaquinone biosynthesis C-methylase UbiE